MNKDIFDTLGPENTHRLFDFLHQWERASRTDPIEDEWRTFQHTLHTKKHRFMCKYGKGPTHLLLGHTERRLLLAYLSRYVPMVHDKNYEGKLPEYEGLKVRWLMEESALEIAYIEPEP